MSIAGTIVKALFEALLRQLKGAREEPGVVRRSADARPLEPTASNSVDEFDLPTAYLPRHERHEAAPARPAEAAAAVNAEHVARRLRDPQGLREAVVMKLILDPPRTIRPSGRGDLWNRNLRRGRGH